jgi:type IV pilus biogenesis protein CpaD/CtpE
LSSIRELSVHDVFIDCWSDVKKILGLAGPIIRCPTLTNFEENSKEEKLNIIKGKAQLKERDVQKARRFVSAWENTRSSSLKSQIPHEE